MKSASILIATFATIQLTACGSVGARQSKSEQGLTAADQPTLVPTDDGFRLAMPNPAGLADEAEPITMPQLPQPSRHFEVKCQTSRHPVARRIVALTELTLLNQRGDVERFSFIYDCPADAVIEVKNLSSDTEYRLSATIRTNPQYEGETPWFSIGHERVAMNMRAKPRTGNVAVDMRFDGHETKRSSLTCTFEGMSVANGCKATPAHQSTGTVHECVVSNGSAQVHGRECRLDVPTGIYQVESLCGDEKRIVNLEASQGNLVVLFQGCEDATPANNVDHGENDNSQENRNADELISEPRADLGR